MEIVSLNNGFDLDGLEADWNRLCERELKYAPSFGRLRDQFRAVGAQYRLLAAVDNSEVKAIACFIYRDTIKRFAMASKTLLELSVKEVSLFGSCVPGQPDAEIIRKLFQIVIDAGGFDVIRVGEVLVDSPLYKVIRSLPSVIAWRTTRQKLQRWLIQMPGSFEEYLSSLGPETRRHAGRYRRKVESVDHEYKVITSPRTSPVFCATQSRSAGHPINGSLATGFMTMSRRETVSSSSQRKAHCTVTCFISAVSHARLPGEN